MLCATVRGMAQMDLLTAGEARNSRNKREVLAALRAGPKTNVELNAICFRYGARIYELRHEGWTIDKRCTAPGIYLYTLKEHQ